MIFGIGWHKTGTHSLQKALNMLGFEGEHYPYWLYWEHGKDSFSPDMKDLKSLSDFPVPLFFKKLDKAYPNSKFILTIRDEEGWVKSIEKHLMLHNTPNPKFNGLSERQHYLNEGLPLDDIHRLAYGQVEFDRDVFLNAYREHNEDVNAYFQNRSDDLLVIDIDQGVEWQPLCAFLETDIPSQAYPHEYKVENRQSAIDQNA